ncbi:MAG: hypothetical protein IKQ71_00765 [Lachnospiraceae bacterium]|nr:hypothetical protein [Lachnospiraceae bacterium]
MSNKFLTYILLFTCFGIIVYGLISMTGGMGKRSSIPGGTPAPIQKKASGSEVRDIDGYNTVINFNYTYDIDALVLSAHSYSGSSVGDKLSPKDLALGWGTVAEHNKDVNISWSQSGRWYHWSCKSIDELAPVGGENGVITQSANTHLIPKDDTIKKIVKKIKTGDHVKLKGYLVSIEGKKADGSTFTWNSSTTREDTGDGSCEVMYVTNVEIVK